MAQDEKLKVGISIGDLNGIGSEIVLKTFEDGRMLDFCTPVIFASTKVLVFLSRKYNCNIKFHGINNVEQAVAGKVNVVNVWKEAVKVSFGEEDPKIGAYAVKSLKAATEALKAEKVDILVTAPINKHNIQGEDFNFPGHTNFLEKELGGNSLMFMITPEDPGLKIGLLTDHVAVKEVSENITPESIEKKINTIYQTLQQDFRVSHPKIAVLGINPHNGDNGVIGKEDDEVLKPTLEKLRNDGKIVMGPYAADSFFGTKNYKNFDAVIAAYHDQGLVPFKTLSFGNGINFTAGLSRIRTSPDHGTAYEIAGQNKADATSFKAALFKGLEIFKNREEYKALTKNALQKQRKRK